MLGFVSVCFVIENYFIRERDLYQEDKKDLFCSEALLGFVDNVVAVIHISVAVCCSVLQYDAVCCSVLQCVAVCCSM